METRQPAGWCPPGVTAAPFIRSGPAAVLDLAGRADRLGYGSLWVAEVTGIEAFSVPGAVSRAAPGLGLGTGVLPALVRTPPLLAMAAACLQVLTPGREVVIEVGVSSPGGGRRLARYRLSGRSDRYHPADYGRRRYGHRYG